MNIDAISAFRRYESVLPRAVNLVLVVLSGVMLARLVWLVVPAPAATAAAMPAPAADAGTARPDPQALVGAIVGAGLFRAADAAAGPAPVDAPETHLNLTLTGILFSQAPHYSVAIIEDAKGHERYYRPRDEVVDGVTLNAIYADRVILERGGRLETLSLAGEQAAHKAAAAAGDDAATARPDLGQLRETLLQKPDSITQFVRLQPVYSDGALRGYRVYPGSKRSLFFSTGLRPGDLVTAINGVSLRDPGKGLAALNELSKAKSVNLTLTRLGQTRNLTISLQ